MTSPPFASPGSADTPKSVARPPVADVAALSDTEVQEPLPPEGAR